MADHTDLSREEEIFYELSRVLHHDNSKMASAVARAELRHLANFYSTETASGDLIASREEISEQDLLEYCRIVLTHLVDAYNGKERRYSLSALQEQSWKFVSFGAIGYFELDITAKRNWRTTTGSSFANRRLNHLGATSWDPSLREIQPIDVTSFIDDLGSHLNIKQLISSDLEKNHPHAFIPVSSANQIFSSEKKWEFWRDWYQSYLDKKPLEFELQARVSKIGDEYWTLGPDTVANEIERIKAEMLAEKLPLAETIELNPETGKFRAVPIAVENPPYMSALLSQISDALEDCLGGHNGLSERSGDIRKLKRVLTKYKDDPQNAELTLTRVASSLRGQLHESRELPDNEDNLALLNAVEEGVRGIRANHPEVAANREQLAKQAFKALTPADKQVLEDAQPVLVALSDPDLADDFERDIPELINDAMLPLPDGAPRLPGVDAATRIFSRASKMATLWDQLNAARDSKAYRLAEIGVTASAAGTLLYQVVSLGLRLLGVI